MGIYLSALDDGDINVGDKVNFSQKLKEIFLSQPEIEFIITIKLYKQENFQLNFFFKKQLNN